MGRIFQMVKLTEEQKQKVVDECIEQIKDDLLMGDETAIDEILKFVPDEYLLGFLAEEDSKKYLKENKS